MGDGPASHGHPRGRRRCGQRDAAPSAKTNTCPRSFRRSPRLSSVAVVICPPSHGHLHAASVAPGHGAWVWPGATRSVCPRPDAARKPTIADGVGSVPACGTTAFRGGAAPFFRCVAATIKTEAQKCRFFAIVGRYFGSKNTGPYFHALLPARLGGNYSAGGKT
jgi:hypothetical protein